AREAELCYGMMAIVTDYDCWNELSETVSTAMVVSNLKKSVQTAKKILRQAIINLPARKECVCGHALKNAIITAHELIPDKARKDLKLIIGKYVK
ncbi:MAG: S-methyl-5'-thioadenosine phosphorylase, partial [Chloroflexi bacterium]|nr:S-methyl-5'-thioadenosine phosphorylase [Chloroflexota bacterium]